MLPILVVVLAQAPGCSKDTDCKGDRICEAGVCVSPSGVSPAPVVEAPPPPAQAPALDPSEFPKVSRHDGLVCVQTLGPDGRVVESCRAEDAPRPKPLPAASAAPERVARTEPPAAPVRTGRFVSDLQLHGGLLVGVAGGTSAALPTVGTTFDLGGRFASGVGLAGFGRLELGIGGTGAILIGTFGPALRLGDRTHVLFAGGPSVISYFVGRTSGAGLAGSFLVSSVFAVAGAFALSIHSALHVDASGVVFTFGAGLGFGAL
ncbi:MAG: hypothetical protein U0228_25560 [Myxococcaceae bacterium]